MTSTPRLPLPAWIVGWNADSPWSTSTIETVPVAYRIGLVASSVTSWTVGVPITAASLMPWMVKETCLLVPSSEVTVKVSTLVSPAPRYCVAELGTE
ncbi:hypothetical protein ACVW1A_004811 [Bradyrhizobium sp. LB1.3]